MLVGLHDVAEEVEEIEEWNQAEDPLASTIGRKLVADVEAMLLHYTEFEDWLVAHEQ